MVMILMIFVGSSMSFGLVCPYGGGVNVGISKFEENLEATVCVFCRMIFGFSSLVALSL